MGMAPTSLAPCTLFCPRIGIIGAPHAPIIPHEQQIEQVVTMSVPVCMLREPHRPQRRGARALRVQLRRPANQLGAECR